MYEVIQVRLREAGKITYFSTGGMKFKVSDYVIVEADRGLDYGQVLSDREAILDSDIDEPLKKVIRKANPWDIHQIDKNKKKIKEIMETCARKIQARKLPMKLIDAEFSFDRSKIIFYFTAEGRVDFRELVNRISCDLNLTPALAVFLEDLNDGGTIAFNRFRMVKIFSAFARVK